MFQYTTPPFVPPGKILVTSLKLVALSYDRASKETNRVTIDTNGLQWKSIEINTLHIANIGKKILKIFTIQFCLLEGLNWQRN